MPKKGEAFNPVRNERVREVISDLNITQRDFAKSIHLSEKTVSGIVNNRQKVIEETARAIVGAYPNACRLEWLLGLDDDKTEQDILDRQILEASQRAELIENSVDNLIGLNGWRMNMRRSSGGEYEFDFRRISDQDWFSMDYGELLRFQDDIKAYVGFRLEQIEKYKQRKRG